MNKKGKQSKETVELMGEMQEINPKAFALKNTFEKNSKKKSTSHDAKEKS